MIQARNIDCATSFTSLTGETSASASFVDMSGTYTIPKDGLYFIGSSLTSRSAGSTKFINTTRAYCGTELIIPEVQFVSTQNYASNNSIRGFISSVFYGRAGDIVKLQTKNANITNHGIIHNSLIKKIV